MKAKVVVLGDELQTLVVLPIRTKLPTVLVRTGTVPLPVRTAYVSILFIPDRMGQHLPLGLSNVRDLFGRCFELLLEVATKIAKFSRRMI